MYILHSWHSQLCNLKLPWTVYLITCLVFYNWNLLLFSRCIDIYCICELYCTVFTCPKRTQNSLPFFSSSIHSPAPFHSLQTRYYIRSQEISCRDRFPLSLHILHSKLHTLLSPSLSPSVPTIFNAKEHNAGSSLYCKPEQTTNTISYLTSNYI